jgi:peptide/nickel transport system permease protein
MSAILSPGDGAPDEQAFRRGALRSTLSILRASPSATFGAFLLIAFIVLAFIAPLIEPFSATTQSCAVFAHPSSRHWLGCDDGGIDMLSLVLQGGRISMVVGFSATVVAMVIGGGVGLVAGYFGGRIDGVLMRITDFFLSLPDLVMMIVVATVWGPSLFHVVIVIGILLWTSTARVIRAQVKTLRERVYVQRARALGASDTRIIIQHILPHVGPLLIANTVLTVAVAVFDETALAFLGLSDPTSTTWGTIIQHAFDRSAVSAGAWWAIVPAGCAIALLIVGCYMLGQAIEDRLNPRLRVSFLSRQTWRLRPLVGRGKAAL